MTDLIGLTLTSAAEMIRARQLSPVELTRAYIERIETFEPDINAFITFTPERALAEAAAAEKEIQAGTYRGPLHGIPIAVKDSFETAGIRTTAGSKLLADFVPETTCEPVERLQRAGVVLLGKLNLHEWQWGTTTNNPFFGATRNPWDLQRIPGGSSGGAGAALAADFCMGALGTDTGGSVRLPAAFCGVVGLKPTRGRISKRGVIPLSWSLDTVGPLARTVRDVAVLTECLAGYDSADPYSIDIPADNYQSALPNGIDGWSIAFLSATPAVAVEHEVAELVAATADVFRQLGANVTEVEFPYFAPARDANRLMAAVDTLALFRDQLRREDFGDDVWERLQNSMRITGADYAAARHQQMCLSRDIDNLFKQYDVLVSPATPLVAPGIKEEQDAAAVAPTSFFLQCFNLVGLPALSLPCGITRNGLPVGLQVAGPVWGEGRVLRAAHAYEQAVGWHLMKPTLMHLKTDNRNEL